ncbi:response regulator transcription factor [Thiolinea disciformis]|uniref:response regulator transcription factor n=1 Tax=Thiolinea disciformis TaxID=125614 RepID=UPI000376441D|nr:response regulator transcription factor [Thiolinea disciformis]
MRLLLADDHGLFREGFALVIQTLFPSVETTQVASWQTLQNTLNQQSFDLIILDLFMPGRHSWEKELTLLMTQQDPPIPICIISASNSRHDIQMAFEIGVQGYISKVSEIDEVKTALSKIMSGQVYVPPSLWSSNSSLKVVGGASLITKRQQEVLGLLATGKSNRQIATRLGLSESTVKRHVYNIFKVLEANNRVEAIDCARQRGILTL